MLRRHLLLLFSLTTTLAKRFTIYLQKILSILHPIPFAEFQSNFATHQKEHYYQYFKQVKLFQHKIPIKVFEVTNMWLELQ